MKFIILLTFFFFTTASYVDADEASPQMRIGLCDNARSTAEGLDCLRREEEEARTRLQSVYERLNGDGEPESLERIEAIQSEWLAYRDSQCAWEIEQTDTESLKRLYELSCLTSLTNQRTDVLSNLLTREEDESPREFGEKPRWMNVLSSNYPAIFWRYSHNISADLDCDGEAEQVVTGLAATPEGTDGLYLELVLATTTNPIAGLPKASLYYLPIENTDPGNEQPFACRPETTLAFFSESTDTTHEFSDSLLTQCGYLEIQAKDCQTVYFYKADGEGFFSSQRPYIVPEEMTEDSIEDTTKDNNIDDVE